MGGKGEVLGIGVIRDLFQSKGTTPVVREELKMREKDIEIEGVVLMSIWERIESRPGAEPDGIRVRR